MCLMLRVPRAGGHLAFFRCCCLSLFTARASFQRKRGFFSAFSRRALKFSKSTPLCFTSAAACGAQ